MKDQGPSLDESILIGKSVERSMRTVSFFSYGDFDCQLDCLQALSAGASCDTSTKGSIHLCTASRRRFVSCLYITKGIASSTVGARGCWGRGCTLWALEAVVEVSCHLGEIQDLYVGHGSFWYLQISFQYSSLRQATHVQRCSLSIHRMQMLLGLQP